MFDGHDIHMVAFSHIQLPDGFPHPAIGHFHFENGMVIPQGDVIGNVIGGIPDGGPICHLLLWIHHLIGAIAQQELGLNVPACSGHHFFRPQLLEQGRRFQRALEVVADGYNAQVIVSHPKGDQEVFAGAVSNLGVGHKGQNGVDPFFVLVHRHNLLVQFVELHGNVPSEPA